MPRVGFEPTISAGERPKTYALDRAATGTGKHVIPHGIYVHVHSKGWMDEKGMELWLGKVWSKRPGGLLKKSHLY